MPFQIVYNNITKMKTEAIVNAANSKLLQGSGVCGAIFKAAGENELQKECNKIGYCEIGEAVITKGYNLTAKYIIHTVGPIYIDGNNNEAELLKNAYQNSLQLAKANNINSIAFPLISTGAYKYPKKEALNIAVNAIKEFLVHNEMNVSLVVIDKDVVTLNKDLFDDIQSYIESYNSISLGSICEYERRYEADKAFYSLNKIQSSIKEFSLSKRSLDDILDNIDESFSQMVLRLIDEKGKSDVEIYKKANMDRKLFSKIRSNKEYKPKKATAISLAIALELNVDETLDLLSKAGYTLSNSHKFDLIIKYFIENKEYNIFKINEALLCFKEQLLSV